MLVKNWWDIYNDKTLDYKRSAITTRAETEAKILEVGLVGYITASSTV
ncbi:unnamed protein product [Coffea canephora]|uniref:Uncharacterized protein n=1 Tax=Coffea canephora TaxID=49390 RepID=A0A068V388_COFCA|nr:unnamed protein product [Coffea canephora]